MASQTRSPVTTPTPRQIRRIGSLAIAGFICLTAFEIVRTALERIGSGLQPIRLDGRELVILLIVLGCNLLAGYERSEAKSFGNQLLLADAKHTSAIRDDGGRLSGPLRVVLFKQTWLDVKTVIPFVALTALLASSEDQPALAGGSDRDRPGIHPRDGHGRPQRPRHRQPRRPRSSSSCTAVVDADDLPTGSRSSSKSTSSGAFCPVRCTIHPNPGSTPNRPPSRDPWLAQGVAHPPSTRLLDLSANSC